MLPDSSHIKRGYKGVREEVGYSDAGASNLRFIIPDESSAHSPHSQRQRIHSMGKVKITIAPRSGAAVGA